jgi:hypothetical protein
MMGMLAAVVIVLILIMIWLYYGTDKSDANPESQPLTSRITQTQDAARSTECRNNLAQIRQAIQIRQAGADETTLSSLAQLQLPDSILRCPVSSQPYAYDPAAGTVRCPTDGHMSF